MHPDAAPEGVRDNGARLDSWKEIAAYLRRDVTTVQRWERREGLPVHRLLHSRQGSVYAFQAELDAWVQSREARSDIGDHLPAATLAVAPDPDHPGRGADPAISTRSRRFLWRRTGLVLGVAALAVLLALMFWRVPAVGPAIEDAAVPRMASVGPSPAGPVAVLAFENQTGDASLDALGRLAAERVIRAVARATHVEVLPRPVEGSSIDTTSERSINVVVAGTYYLREAALEFQVRILDAPSGRLLHGLAPIVEPRLNTAAALDQVEQGVAGAIAIHFDDFFGGLQAVAHPPTLNAYREYRAGLEVFQSDYRRSLAHLERALELDPDFLLPSVIMEFVFLNQGADDDVERVLARMEGMADRSSAAERQWIEFARASLEGRRPQALRLLLDLERTMPASLLVNFNILQQAVALNRPALAVQTFDRVPSVDRSLRHSIGVYRTIIVMQALHMLGNYERELEESKRAQEYAPGVHLFLMAEARALAALGRVAEVTRVSERSLSTGPVAGARHDAGRVMEEAAVELRAHGHLEASRQAAARAVDWYANRPPGTTSDPGHRVDLASALYLAERWEDARRVYAALRSDYPGQPGYLAHLGQLAAHTGDVSQARLVSEQLSRVGTTGPSGRESLAWILFERGRIAALLGEPARAVELLRDAIANGFPVGLNIHQDPDLEVLHTYPAFVALTRPSS